ncbi:MAG TPA: hypothetical protein VKA83_22225 [Methylomirabilota bacterium]|nr:hypothetical protein [Methylomirabilota bacterium]
MRPVSTDPINRDDERAEARRKLAYAVDLVSRYAMVTARQREAILEALNAADWQLALQHAEVKRLERENGRLARPATSTRDTATLLEYIDTAHGLICNAHNKTVDHVTVADGASPGWAEAARRWIDAYPPQTTDHAAFAAEVHRLRDQAHAAQVADLTAQRDQARADLDRETDELRRERDHLRGQAHHAITERDRAQHELEHLREQVAQLEREIVLRTEETDQRDREISKRRASYREMRAERDKAVHQLDQARADAEAAEDRLEQIAAVLNRTPFPPDRDHPGSWTDYVHQRQELARHLRDTPGRVVPLHPEYEFHLGDHFMPAAERDDTDMTAGEFREAFNRATPGPRPGPRPAGPPPAAEPDHLA